MQRKMIVSITQGELDSYVAIYEKLSFYHTLKKISSDRSGEYIVEIQKEIQYELKLLRYWWKYIDEKYFLPYSDRELMFVDTYRRYIYSEKRK